MSDEKEVLPLHLHTNFSILDGASPVEDYVKYAKEHQMPVCSCTDHGYVMGLYNLVRSCEREGVTPIPGLEAYLMPGDDYVHEGLGRPPRYFHLTLWAMNNRGWDSLKELGSRSWDEGRVVSTFGSMKPRITWEDLAECNEGLVCGSGCILGPVARPLLDGNRKMAARNFGKLREIFGNSGRLFMEVMPSRVTHNHCRGDVVTVKTADGRYTLTFHPDDTITTATGQVMKASEAFEKKVTAIADATPPRAQPVAINLENIPDQPIEL